MPYTKILIHAVWSTKNNEPNLLPEIKLKVIEHIKEQALKKCISIEEIDGAKDHLHCLIRMETEQNIATIMNLIKGESSYWINKNINLKTKFHWQDEYFAVSIGESQLAVLKEYIRNQETHHKKKTFQQEYDEFIEKYGF